MNICLRFSNQTFINDLHHSGHAYSNNVKGGIIFIWIDINNKK